MSATVEIFLPMSETARRLGVSVREVYRLIAEGELRPVKVHRRSTRFPESEVVAYQDKLKQQRPPACTMKP